MFDRIFIIWMSCKRVYRFIFINGVVSTSQISKNYSLKYDIYWVLIGRPFILYFFYCYFLNQHILVNIAPQWSNFMSIFCLLSYDKLHNIHCSNIDYFLYKGGVHLNVSSDKCRSRQYRSFRIPTLKLWLDISLLTYTRVIFYISG